MSQALGRGEPGNTRETDRHGCYLHVVTIQRGRRTLFKHTHKYDTVTSARKEKWWVQTRAWNTAGSVTWI